MAADETTSGFSELVLLRPLKDGDQVGGGG
jgi:hypothetical protein